MPGVWLYLAVSSQGEGWIAFQPSLCYIPGLLALLNSALSLIHHLYQPLSACLTLSSSNKDSDTYATCGTSRTRVDHPTRFDTIVIGTLVSVLRAGSEHDHTLYTASCYRWYQLVHLDHLANMALFSITSLQQALPVKSAPSIAISNTQCTTSTLPVSPQPRIPTAEYVATRLHGIASYKLRLEASENEPRLRKLLGHISIYDAVREHHRSQSVYTSPSMARRRQQQLQRRQQSELGKLAPTLNSITEDIEATTETESSNAADIQDYLDSISGPHTQVQDFASFQRAIEAQIASLSQLRVEAASRQLFHMTNESDDADEQAVEEYDDDYDDESSDYDSYDGDDDWRNQEFVFDDQDSQTHDYESDTDPDSVNSEPPSPTTEEPTMLDCKGDISPTKISSPESCYFLPL
jgi:hypothetical protein